MDENKSLNNIKDIVNKSIEHINNLKNSADEILKNFDFIYVKKYLENERNKNITQDILYKNKKKNEIECKYVPTMKELKNNTKELLNHLINNVDCYFVDNNNGLFATKIEDKIILYFYLQSSNKGVK